MEELRKTGVIRFSVRQRIRCKLIMWIMSPSMRLEFDSSYGEEAKLGSVTWFVTNCETGEVSEPIESIPMLSEVRIELGDSDLVGATQVKSIRLSDQYKLVLHDSQTQSVRQGFALNVKDQLSPMNFGWEWFLVDSPEHATKLQETGELELTLRDPKELVEVIGCKFLTDVSLRFSSEEYSMNRPMDPLKSEFRLTIKAGSYVRWPVLVDGVIRMHGWA